MTDLRDHLNDREAEEALVGSALINPSVHADAAVTGIRANFFFTQCLGTIWQAILDLIANNSSLDIVTVGDLLQKRKELSDIGGPAYLTQLSLAAPNSVHASDYAEIIRDLWLKRELTDMAVRTAKAVTQHRHLVR